MNFVDLHARLYRRHEPAVRLVLILAMVVTGVWWVLHVPDEPEAFWRAIPEGAVYFSRHIDAADRLPALTRNPLTVTLLRSAGVSPEAILSVNDSAEARSWVDKLFGRDLVMAYVPGLGANGEDAWVFVSRIGRYERRLRWSLAFLDVSGFVSHEIPGYPELWVLEEAPIETGRHVSLALADGLLMVCISADPTAVRIPLATWNRRAGYRSLHDAGLADQHLLMEQGVANDWGAYVLRRQAPDALKPPAVLIPVLQTLEPLYAKGSVLGNFDAPGASNDKTTTITAVDELRSILGNAPVLWTVASPRVFNVLLRHAATPAWAAELAEALRPPVSEHAGITEDGDSKTFPGGYHEVFLAVLSAQYSGRIQIPGGGWGTALPAGGGLKVPAVVAGVRVADADSADALLMDMLDRLNRKYRLGLIPRRDPGSAVTVIEDSSAGRSFYQGLALHEKAGTMYHEGWLLIAVQSGILRQLIREADVETRLRHNAAWLPETPDDIKLAYGWVDLQPFATLANDALAAASLVFLLNDPLGSFESRRKLSNARAWIESLRAPGPARIWFDTADPGFNLRFELGIGGH